MERDVIIACDFPSKEKLAEFLEPFKGMDPYLKIGMEIFDKEGPSLVKELKEMGFHIFLDLKLHDIPNTVKSALAKLGELGVDIINIHAEGGIEMMKAAREGLNMSEAGKKTKLIAVTILTSLNDDILHNELLIDPKYSLRDVVRHYAENVKAAGLDGVVCSALEAPMMKDLRDRDKLKEHCGSCKNRTLCGGCRARAYGYFEDHLAPDPGCIYNQKAWDELVAENKVQSESEGI